MALKELNDTVVQETISKIFNIMEYEDDSSFRFEENENLYIKKDTSLENNLFSKLVWI